MLAAVAKALRPDGVFLMQDIRASSHVHKNIDHPLGTFTYTVSCMHCMTVSLALGGEGLGAAWGEEKALELLAEAGFGKVEVEQNEPVFHAEWERRVFALTGAMGATEEWNLDQVRFAREDRNPVEYLAMSYYERWLSGLERMLAQHGLVGSDELAAGRSLRPGKAVRRVLAAEDVAAFGRSDPTREPSRPARFAAGDRVLALNMHPSGHTRLPRYVRGHIGTIVLVHGAHVFPDSSAHGRGDDPRWLYTVSFGAHELWGAKADPTLTVSVDAFEPYLEAA